MEDLQSTCRLCLKVDSELALDIFKGNEGNYAEKIFDIMSIELENTETWPSIACVECISFLDKMYDFREKIMASHLTLHKRIYAPKPMEVEVDNKPEDTPSDGDDKSSKSDLPENELPKIESEKEENGQKPDNDLSDTEVPGIDNDDDSSLDSLSESDDDAPLKPASSSTSAAADARKKRNDAKVRAAILKLKSGQSKNALKEFYNRRLELKKREEKWKSLEDTINTMELLQCKVCGEKTKDFQALKDHVRKQHDIKTYEYCCDRRLTIKPDFMDHVHLHVDKDAFNCDQCGKSYISSSQLNGHKIKIHGAKSLICELCGKGFIYQSKYKKHMETHTNPGPTCKYCGKVYKGDYALKSHIATHHEIVVNFICHLCGKGFPSMGTLRSHLHYHSGPHGGPGQFKKWSQKKKPTTEGK